MFRIKNEGTRAEIYIYGSIGSDMWEEGVEAEGFSKQLAELAPKPLDIHIDSGGGDVYEAFAICSAIQRYEGMTTAYIDGLAASAASYIAVVCDRVVMNDYAFLMIHKAHTMAFGNADYLTNVVERLNMIDETLAQIYEKRSVFTLDEVRAQMAAERWFTADEALEHGLAQEVLVTEERMAACVDRDLAKFYEHKPDAVVVDDVTSHTASIVDKKVTEAVTSYLMLGEKIFRKESNA